MVECISIKKRYEFNTFAKGKYITPKREKKKKRKKKIGNIKTFNDSAFFWLGLVGNILSAFPINSYN